MKKILFVEDDALISRIYTQKLTEAGFEIAAAADGLEAVKLLPEFKPDLVVLDLLMPRLTGPDVLKFMRQHPDLKSTRVIVFSNSFLSNLVDQVAAIKVEKTLVKAAVTPARLIEEILGVLDRPSQGGATPVKTDAPTINIIKPKRTAQTAPPVAPVIKPVTPPAAAPTVAPSVAPATMPAVKPPAKTATSEKPAAEKLAAAPPPPERKSDSDSEFLTRMGRQFRERTPAIFKELRQRCREYLEAAGSADEADKLVALNRKLGFLTQIAGMAGYPGTAELSSALEALLFELADKPASVSDSARQTIATTIAFLAERFEQSDSSGEQPRAAAAILVVDDDAVTNRALVLALERVKLAADSLADPHEALKKLEATAYGVVLMDIAMPGMDGLALCEQMRKLPLHKRTPVIFVTSHTDFKTRARSILSGGDDLITKPILLTELCVKVLTHLLNTGS